MEKYTICYYTYITYNKIYFDKLNVIIVEQTETGRNWTKIKSDNVCVFVGNNLVECIYYWIGI